MPVLVLEARPRLLLLYYIISYYIISYYKAIAIIISVYALQTKVSTQSACRRSRKACEEASQLSSSQLSSSDGSHSCLAPQKSSHCSRSDADRPPSSPRVSAPAPPCAARDAQSGGAPPRQASPDDAFLAGRGFGSQDAPCIIALNASQPSDQFPSHPPQTSHAHVMKTFDPPRSRPSVNATFLRAAEKQRTTLALSHPTPSLQASPAPAPRCAPTTAKSWQSSQARGPRARQLRQIVKKIR